MTNFETIDGAQVIHCPDCDATIGSDNPRASLAHCADGSHVYGIDAIAHDVDDTTVDCA